MAGHSKWANRKHRKERQDAKKGKVFSKMAREITLAARQGGDLDTNNRLRLAVEKAKELGVPNENIDRAIKRGTGELGGADYEELMYEGYGPGGVALLLDIATDNRNRTAGDVRFIFSKYGGNMAESGAVAWMFERKGTITIDKSEALDADELMLNALEAGAEDIKEDEENFTVIASPQDIAGVAEGLAAMGIDVSTTDITMLPTNEVTVGGKDAEKLMVLLDALEDHDDVQDIYGNFVFDEETLASME